MSELLTIGNVDKIADVSKLHKSLKLKREIGRLPTIATNCSVSSLTLRELTRFQVRFLLNSYLRKTGGDILGIVQYFSLIDGRHFIYLSTSSITRLEDFHTITLTWGDIYFQTTFGNRGIVIIEIPPVDILQIGLMKVVRDGQEFTKFKFNYNSKRYDFDEHMINSVRSMGVKIDDGAKCLIL